MKENAVKSFVCAAVNFNVAKARIDGKIGGHHFIGIKMHRLKTKTSGFSLAECYQLFADAAPGCRWQHRDAVEVHMVALWEEGYVAQQVAAIIQNHVYLARRNLS